MSSFPFHPRRQRQRLGFSPVGKGEDSPRLLTKTAFPGGEPSSQHGASKGNQIPNFFLLFFFYFFRLLPLFVPFGFISY
ncbi:hypothetical protein Lalb_Chr03g0042501 [Lupinus albus]|uniref:Uncharacterized protein n=1 Tax=Lupinus albus TaxID=3870 RepID=A0A6A4P1D8_LUPAL|nr:hypothetical protein Lalb_Chr19g0139541 [Lupinus albus]KAE9618094.1 hypothetical protein Lalb_Chr03g0042501 [Lupinus albus]